MDDGRYISLQHLRELKGGLAAPSEQWVFALASLFRGVAGEAEIDECLVTPFRPGA